MGDELNGLKGRGVMIFKNTGKIVDLRDVTIKEITLGELEPGDERVELHTPSCLGEQKTITFTVKPRSKRKFHKAVYWLHRPFKKRAYLSKRELVNIIARSLHDGVLPMPISYYMAFTHKQLMKIIKDALYAMKEFRKLNEQVKEQLKEQGNE